VKTQYVAELVEGCRIDTALVMRAKEMRIARTGDAFLSLEFADRSGQLAGVWFRPEPDLASVPIGSVVHVRGTVTSFRNRKRVSVESLRPLCDWDPADFLSSGPRDESELLAEMRALLASVSDAGLSALLRSVFSDKEFFARFKRCPGSQSYHHAYLGGLLEHTVSVASLCSTLAQAYDSVERDLLVASALLHDVGKVDEISFETSIEYTDEGRLVGHVVLGVRRVHDAAARAKTRIRPDSLMRLEHAVLSHHGELEWGSPKRPSTLEALLLHHADNLDAKVSGFASLLSGASRADEVWTDASNLFRRPLYAPRPVDADRLQPVLEDEQSCLMTA
jgi:3'-5' exoribonuclease